MRKIHNCILVLCILAAAAAGLLHQRKYNAGGKSEAQLSLQAQVQGDTMNIVWDPNTPVLRDAGGGTLTIRDGPLLRNVALSARELQSRNSVVYAPTTNEVELQLKISGPKIATQCQSVLVVLGPSKPPPIQAETNEPRPTNGPDPAPDRPTETHLIQTVSIKQEGGDGMRGRAYQPPEPIERVKPDLSAQLEPLVLGEVEIDVRVTINPQGKVVTARPVSQSGSLAGSTTQRTQIARAVMNAARRWSFRPAQINFRTVPSQLVLAFQLAKDG